MSLPNANVISGNITNLTVFNKGFWFQGEPIEPGDCLVVWWLDSGSGNSGNDEDGSPLCIKETHGRVVGVIEENLVLRMCGAGSEDTGSEFGGIWIYSIKHIENFGNLNDRTKWETNK